MNNSKTMLLDSTMRLCIFIFALSIQCFVAFGNKGEEESFGARNAGYSFSTPGVDFTMSPSPASEEALQNSDLGDSETTTTSFEFPSDGLETNEEPANSVNSHTTMPGEKTTAPYTGVFYFPSSGPSDPEAEAHTKSEGVVFHFPVDEPVIAVAEASTSAPPLEMEVFEEPVIAVAEASTSAPSLKIELFEFPTSAPHSEHMSDFPTQTPTEQIYTEETSALHSMGDNHSHVNGTDCDNEGQENVQANTDGGAIRSPSYLPSDMPSTSPSGVPSDAPSMLPSIQPTLVLSTQTEAPVHSNDTDCGPGDNNEELETEVDQAHKGSLVNQSARDNTTTDLDASQGLPPEVNFSSSHWEIPSQTLNSSASPASGALSQSPTGSSVPTDQPPSANSLPPEVHFSASYWMTHSPSESPITYTPSQKPSTEPSSSSLDSNSNPVVSHSLPPEVHFSANYWITPNPSRYSSAPSATRAPGQSPVNVPTEFPKSESLSTPSQAAHSLSPEVKFSAGSWIVPSATSSSIPQQEPEDLSPEVQFAAKYWTVTPSSSDTQYPSNRPKSLSPEVQFSANYWKSSSRPSDSPVQNLSPTVWPSDGTSMPSAMPSDGPSGEGPMFESDTLTETPTESPLQGPNDFPEDTPAISPTAVWHPESHVFLFPTINPAILPSSEPSVVPNTMTPEEVAIFNVLQTAQPSVPATNTLVGETLMPTDAPSVVEPTKAQYSEKPSRRPSLSPMLASISPSVPPPTSSLPSIYPSQAPTADPSRAPTTGLTTDPTQSPSSSRPTNMPSSEMTTAPSSMPSIPTLQFLESMLLPTKSDPAPEIPETTPLVPLQTDTDTKKTDTGQHTLLDIICEISNGVFCKPSP